MIHVLASIKVKDSCMAAFLEIFKANMSNVLAEKGCVEYIPTIDFNTDLPPQIFDSNVITVIEKWECFENLQAHLSAPHMLEYKSKVESLIEGVVLKILKPA